MASTNPKTWPARAREAVRRWRSCVQDWRRVFPKVVLRLDGTRYLAGELPGDLTPQEREVAGWKEEVAWQPGPQGMQIGRGPRDADEAKEMGWVRAEAWSRGPTATTQAALKLVAASQALISIAASPRIAISILPLQRFRDAIKGLQPSLSQLDLLPDAQHLAEHIELRYPSGRSEGLPVLTSKHWKIVEVLQGFGDRGALISEIVVAGCRGKTLQRRLHDLEAHHIVELIEGGRKWRLIGQSSDT